MSTRFCGSVVGDEDWEVVQNFGDEKPPLILSLL